MHTDGIPHTVLMSMYLLLLVYARIFFLILTLHHHAHFLHLHFIRLFQDSEDDPYYMTMHKLWTKMCEKDWRTTVKALYILHAISRDCELDACESFSIAIKYALAPDYSCASQHCAH